MMVLAEISLAKDDFEYSPIHLNGCGGPKK